MSSTDTDLKIKALFDKVIEASAGRSYLNTKPDKDAGTYYEQPQHPAQAYFSFIDTSSEVQFAAYLDEFWKSSGSTEFSVLSKDLAGLAFILSSDSEQQSTELSPFIYTMY